MKYITINITALDGRTWERIPPRDKRTGKPLYSAPESFVAWTRKEIEDRYGIATITRVAKQ